MLLAGRVRKPEEEAIILSILEKQFKRTVNPETLFSQKQVTSQFSEYNSSLLHDTGAPQPPHPFTPDCITAAVTIYIYWNTI